MHRTGRPHQSFPYTCTTIDGVVAVEPVGQSYRVFVRDNSGITFHDYPFSPFILLSDPGLAADAPVIVNHHHLAGSGKLCWLTELANWHDWYLLRDYLHRLGKPDAWFAIQDGCQQFLMTSGITFFQGLAFKDHRYICIAIQKDAHSLHAIAVTNGLDYQEFVSSSHQTEAEMLTHLTQIIQDQDPDVIAGYQLNRSALPYLVQLAQKHKVSLAWGRNGSVPYQHQAVDHRTLQQYAVFGRSVVDVETLVSHYNRHRQPLSATAPDQTSVLLGSPEQTIADKETDIAAAGQASALYQLHVEFWYLHAQSYPVNFQNVFYKPEATSIDALLIREYLQQQHALPALSAAQKQHKHADEQLLFQGQAGPVIRCDLSRLSASIMVAYRITPRSDELGIFSRLLTQTAQHYATRHSNDSNPGISAWLELLGTSCCLFSDAAAAAEVERLKHVITKDLLSWLRDAGAWPIAVNSQELYFIPPDGHEDGSREISILLQRLGSILPSGVALPYTGPYPSMFIYKANQYAVLTDSGQVFFKGAIFRSRSMEPFLQEFISEAARLFLTGNGMAIEQLYASFVRRLTAASCPVDWIMRCETLADSQEQYLQAVQRGARNRAAVYELALREKENWRVGEKISYYVTGVSKNCVVHASCKLAKDFDPQYLDLNKAWYLERLHQLFKRLTPFLPAEPLLFR
ncbi:DNA polymerase elongation subunit (family B) [Trichlorobacter thiogenes]|uniref:DNA polymerase elongation subunit (Family B) n=1 Tax=Trichlorobacter thiogenes TaxID=115783 RepID=A0A1T4RFG6_9BACT|nr:3'-5' exonuclease [Trichlorobacter thiogenes]SKA14659.1 DNA polymerase elongation subunit (family B) [Trichlorobacter thiogenes]